MTAEDKKNASNGRPIILSPWLAVVLGLLLYGLTLNHWVCLRSMQLIAPLTGWDWHPLPLTWHDERMLPLFTILTSPVRLLRAGWQPLVLNIFTAVCAAVTLGLLARTVRLMPQDRTKEQRTREGGAHALLSIRAAFLPPLFAVLMLASQLTFWQNAVAASSEMLNLLVFAFIINCLLEYRVSQNDKWLLVSALVYGLGAADNWALLGFAPLYIVALFWLRGFLGFFSRRFLTRMFFCGLAGLLMYLVLPLLGVWRGAGQGFWPLLHQELGEQTYGLRLVPRWVAVVAAVPTIVPLLFAAIKWPTFEGEISAAGNNLTRFMLGVLHVACLAVVLVTFFDFKYSPSLRMREQPVSFLTFYYIAAMCLGYFSGYMLLIFGVTRLMPWERMSSFVKAFNFIMLAVAWILALGAPILLLCQNYPHIRAGNSGALQQFADLTLDGLPKKTSIVLSDDPARLYLLQANCERRGLPNDHILINTADFPHREYIEQLVSIYPALRSVMTTNLSRLPEFLSSDSVVKFMYLVTQNYPVYYLHPSFGYYFEALYLQPRGIVYELKPYSTNLTQPPVATEEEIKTNEAYWAKLEEGPLKDLPELAKSDTDAEAVSIDYAVSLNYWGTELQKANHLKEAHQQFTEAIRLNTNNFIAAINREYNERLQQGHHEPIDSTEAIYNAINYYRGLVPVLRRNGPVDEPGLNLALGQIMARYGNLGQSAILFQRRLQLLPGDPETELAMAKTYVDTRQSAKALDLITKLRGSTNVNAWSLAWTEAAAYMAGGDYTSSEKVLRGAIKADPNDENRVAALAEYYRVRGLESYREGKNTDAAHWFASALTNFDLQLQLLSSPTHDTVPTFDVPDTLLKKAELLILLDSYANAVSVLTQVLEVQPKNQTAVLNRAVCEIGTKQFPAAIEDFNTLRKLLPQQTYLADLGLADVAHAENNKAEEKACLKLCFKSAPQDTPEYCRTTLRLADFAHAENNKTDELEYLKLYVKFAPPNMLEYREATKRLQQLAGN